MFLNIFIYWISFLPLVVWNGLYEGPKIIYFLTGIIGVILFWFYRILKEKHNFEFSKQDCFFLSFVALLLISSFYGVHPFESVIGGSYRHQGVIFFTGLWLVGKTIQILPGDKKKTLSEFLALTVFAEALIAVVQYLTGHVYFDRPLGTIGESNALFGFLVIGMYFVLGSLSKPYLIPIYIVVLTSMSRSALLSLLLFSGIFISKLKSSFQKPIVLIGLSLTIVATLYITKTKGFSWFESRPVIWKIAVNEIAKKPILGYGAESGEFIFNKVFLSRDINLENIIVDRTHNLFLDILMWTGILGIITFGGWLFLSFTNLATMEKKFAFLSFLTYSMFQPLSIVHWILLIIIVTI